MTIKRVKLFEQNGIIKGNNHWAVVSFRVLFVKFRILLQRKL